MESASSSIDNGDFTEDELLGMPVMICDVPAINRRPRLRLTRSEICSALQNEIEVVKEYELEVDGSLNQPSEFIEMVQATSSNDDPHEMLLQIDIVQDDKLPADEGNQDELPEIEEESAVEDSQTSSDEESGDSLEGDGRGSGDVETDDQENKTQPKKRKRRADRNKRSLPATKNRQLRIKGKAYFGVKKNDETGAYAYDKERPARAMSETCSQPFCAKAKNRFCSVFNAEDRTKEFNTFWGKMDWEMRKIYITSLVEYAQIKDTNKRAKKRSNANYRCKTAIYHLKKDGHNLQVCKKMFLGTLGLSEWSVRNWCLQGQTGTVTPRDVNSIMPKRNRQTTNVIVESKSYVTEFLRALPKLPSHYCRASTTMLYLEPTFRSFQDLYREYKKEARDKNKPTVSITQFRLEMDEQKIHIFMPKKDLCDTCVSHGLGHVIDAVHNEHLQRKSDARESKERDKQTAKESPSKVCAFTMDVQAVKLSPSLLASAVYYKTKLCVHNFTIHNQASRDVTCYLWHEGQGGLDATNFATMVVDFLEAHLLKNPNTETVIIYSDGCGYQNRNNTLANALLQFSCQRNIIVVQKYLEKGHTQMEVDNVHAIIERQLKNREIYLPTDYISICVGSRKKQPYQVKYLSYDFFKSYAQVKYYSSIRPGHKTGDPTVADLRCIKYEPCGEIKYKLNYSDEWTSLPKRPQKGPFPVLPMYTAELKIKTEKYQHLQELKHVLPAHSWAFYDALPH